jgi:hypothetical protein
MLSQGKFTSLAFGVVDKVLYQLSGLRTVPLLRSYARKQCTQRILERQEKTGDWAGIFPPMHGSVYAFMLEGSLAMSVARNGEDFNRGPDWNRLLVKSVLKYTAGCLDVTIIHIYTLD